jgi:hypothetical protein
MSAFAPSLTAASASPFPLRDFVVDEVENRIPERGRDDEHDQDVRHAASPGDPRREQSEARKEREPTQVEETWIVPVPPPLRIIGPLATVARGYNRQAERVPEPSSADTGELGSDCNLARPR